MMFSRKVRSRSHSCNHRSEESEFRSGDASEQNLPVLRAVSPNGALLSTARLLRDDHFDAGS